MTDNVKTSKKGSAPVTGSMSIGGTPMLHAGVMIGKSVTRRFKSEVCEKPIFAIAAAHVC